MRAISTAWAALGESKKTIVPSVGSLDPSREIISLCCAERFAATSVKFRGSSVMPHVRDRFDPGRDLNVTLLHFFGSEHARGTEDQGVMFHKFLLWAGGLTGDAPGSPVTAKMIFMSRM